MKKLFKFLTLLVVVGFIAFGLAMFFTKDLSSTADGFFKSIKNGNYNEAEKYLSVNFKQVTTIDQLKKAFPVSRFKDYKDCSFTTRVANADGTGKLKGKINFTDGSAIPVEIALIKENGSWKINHINLPRSGITTTSSVNVDRPKQNQTDIAGIVKETMEKLGNAIATGYYSDFYSYTAPQFQNTVTIEKLEKAFKPFKQAPINWKDVSNLNPVIQKKEKESNGVLKILGYFPSQPKKVGFDFEYYKNNGKWQIVGVFIRLQD